jgi:hypothetical protein
MPGRSDAAHKENATVLHEKSEAIGPAARLERVAPGYYVDGYGEEYFYLTGIYPTLTERITGDPVLNTPRFIAGLLDELRSALQDRLYVELMD